MYYLTCDLTIAPWWLSRDHPTYPKRGIVCWYPINDLQFTRGSWPLKVALDLKDYWFKLWCGEGHSQYAAKLRLVKVED